jgi:hypothetical protein
MSPGGKQTALACHLTKKVYKAEELTYLSTNIVYTHNNITDLLKAEISTQTTLRFSPLVIQMVVIILPKDSFTLAKFAAKTLHSHLWQRQYLSWLPLTG